MRYNYKVDIDLSDRNTSWFHILRLVGSDKRVLDIGCATGHLTKHLAANNCEVVGVELEKSFASEAVPYCQEVIVGNIQEDSTLSKITGKFDVIVFGDVLEHLTHPEEVLTKTRKLLNKDGFIVVSLPNIALWRIRMALLFGRFDYADRGVLDNTHLRFFTLKSAKELLQTAGYTYEHLCYRFDIPFYSRRLARYTIYLGDIIPRIFRKLLPTVFAFQFIFKAKPVETSEVTKPE
jgi:2-polyprenyl-3-methyl-5-hydroxy-6-metoxy-1,4-benzoquinol methylase